MIPFLQDREIRKMICEMTSELARGGPNADKVVDALSQDLGLYRLIDALSRLHTAMKGYLRKKTFHNQSKPPAVGPNEPMARAQTECGSKPQQPEPAHLSSPRFERFNKILEEIRDLHARKSRDYGTDHDPYQNVRASREFGIPPWLGAILRANDKIHRLKAFSVNGSLNNESVEDAMLDLASYAVIGLILYREGSTGKTISELAGLHPDHE